MELLDKNQLLTDAKERLKRDGVEYLLVISNHLMVNKAGIVGLNGFKNEINTISFKLVKVDVIDQIPYTNLFSVDKRAGKAFFKMTQKCRPVFDSLPDYCDVNECGYLIPWKEHIDRFGAYTCNNGERAEQYLRIDRTTSHGKLDAVIPEKVGKYGCKQQELRVQIKCSLTAGAGYSSTNCL